MKRHKTSPSRWFGTVTAQDLRKVLTLIRRDGPLTIRDIDDDVLVEKDHPWASRKPSKRALQLAFYTGAVTVRERVGMLKSYELMERHFGWEDRPKPATGRQIGAYLLDRAVRAQGFVSLDSVCYLDTAGKPSVRTAIEVAVRRRELVPVQVEGCETIAHWARPDALEALETDGADHTDIVHILSPFDPLIIQRRRLSNVFGYEHRFEAYVPKDKRVLGYFALPVLVGDAIVAAVDLKTDRAQRKLCVQQWTWTAPGSARRHKRLIEEELHRFEQFQLG